MVTASKETTSSDESYLKTFNELLLSLYNAINDREAEKQYPSGFHGIDRAHRAVFDAECELREHVAGIARKERERCASMCDRRSNAQLVSLSSQEADIRRTALLAAASEIRGEDD